MRDVVVGPGFKQKLSNATQWNRETLAKFMEFLRDPALFALETPSRLACLAVQLAPGKYLFVFHEYYPNSIILIDVGEACPPSIPVIKVTPDLSFPDPIPYPADQLIFTLIWDAGAIDEEDYLALRTALGDLARAAGAAGLERVGGDSTGVYCGAGVTLND